MNSSQPTFHPIVPGGRIPGDWYDGVIPENIEVGIDCLIDSAHVFKRCSSTAQPALRLGDRVTLWNVTLSPIGEGRIEIGSDSHLQGASLAVSELVVIGERCAIGHAVTIFDSDFHPVGAAERRLDTYATRPRGDQIRRPIDTAPVYVGDDVWISPGAAIAKGVTIGDGAQVLPGAVVLRDVPDGATVAGNPADVW